MGDWKNWAIAILFIIVGLLYMKDYHEGFRGLDENKPSYINRIDIPPEPEPTVCRLTYNAVQYPYDVSDKHKNVSLNCGHTKPAGYVAARDAGRPRQTRFLGGVWNSLWNL